MPNIYRVLVCQARPSLGNLSCLLNFFGLFVFTSAVFIGLIGSMQIGELRYRYIAAILACAGATMMGSGSLLFFHLNRMHRLEIEELERLERSDVMRSMMSALAPVHIPVGPSASHPFAAPRSFNNSIKKPDNPLPMFPSEPKPFDRVKINFADSDSVATHTPMTPPVIPEECERPAVEHMV